MLFDYIKETCDGKDISIAELERRAGLSNGAVRKWNKSIPNTNTLQRVSVALDVPLSTLINKCSETEGK